jgi:pyrroline-5-carboxylate reductase
VISLAAGITLHKIESVLYAPLSEQDIQRLAIIRVMPNTPALVLEGMSGMSPNENADPEDIHLAKRMLNAMGSVLEFEERQLDAVTALSGSGPAYVFFLVESMVEAGVKVGLSPDEASFLTLKTLRGSLMLMEKTGETPEALRRKVTSPGGTTEAAFKVLTSRKVKETLIEAITAATQRAEALSR